MAIQMMKGYGFPSARAVDFSGFGDFGDYAFDAFYGGHDPSQFRKIPPLDGYGYESYNAAGEDEASMALACRATGGVWDGMNGVCVKRQPPVSQPGHDQPLLDHPPPPDQKPPAPPPSNTLGKVLGWGAAIYFAARMLK